MTFILVTGSRDWHDSELIRSVLQQHVNEEVTLIEGGCKGADCLCAKVANEFGFKVVEMPANWGKHGRAAGPIRNREMVNMLLSHIAKGKPGYMYAFHDNLSTSAGTKDCVEYARSKGITPLLIQHKST